MNQMLCFSEICKAFSANNTEPVLKNDTEEYLNQIKFLKNENASKNEIIKILSNNIGNCMNTLENQNQQVSENILAKNDANFITQKENRRKKKILKIL